jgi:cell wall-associated NlpC family hydrolase
MKGIFRAVLAPLVVILSGCVPPSGQHDVEALIAEAKQRFAPDRRTLVFDITPTLSGAVLTLRGEIHSPSLKSDLLNFLRERTHLTLVDSMKALPDPALEPRTFGVVTLSVANIRTEPDHGAEMATQAILGSPVRVLKNRGGWSYVQTQDAYLGWTDDHIVRMSSEEYDRWSLKSRVIVTSPYAWVRESPATDAQPVSDVVAGAILALAGKKGSCYEVEYPDGRRGFLPVNDAALLDQWLDHARDTHATILKTAKGLMGVPYLWGGTSTKGMDCSGFTKTVYFLNGVLLPRDANQQADVGDSVGIAGEFQPGDLLFFGRRATEKKPEHITHVAIALGGRRFIHASGEVKMNSLDPADADYSGFRADSFVRARRIIGAGEASGVHRLAGIPYYHPHEP